MIVIEMIDPQSFPIWYRNHLDVFDILWIRSKPRTNQIGRSDSDSQLYSWENQLENHFWTDSFQIEITFELNQLENCLIQTLFQSLTDFIWCWLVQMTNKYF